MNEPFMQRARVARILLTGAVAGISLGAGVAALVQPSLFWIVLLAAWAGAATAAYLAYARLRLAAGLGATAASALLLWLAVDLLLGREGIAAIFGVPAVLMLQTLSRYGIGVAAIVCVLRLLSQRHRVFLALELLLYAAALASPFAAHRFGQLARPLWLSDWALRHGFEPQSLLIAIGLAAALAMLLLLRERRRPILPALLFIGVLVGFAGMLVRVGDLARPESTTGSAATEETQAQGDPLQTGDDSDADESSRGNEPSPGGADSSQGGADGSKGEESSSADREGQDGRGQRQAKGKAKGKGESQGNGRSQSAGSGGAPSPSQGTAQGRGQKPFDPNPGGPDRRPVPVAVLILEDDYAPPTQSFYLRAESWSEFNGHRLVQAREPALDGDSVAVLPVQPLHVREVPPSASRSSVSARVALITSQARPFALESPVRFEPIVNPDPKKFVGAYRFTSLALSAAPEALFGADAGEAQWPKPKRAHYLRLPDDPRYAALARRIVAAMPAAAQSDPWAQALSVKRWLDDNVTYSTRDRHEGAFDPTADFLFGNKTGYCVHFAHAAVYLWRALGIPARVSAGYSVAEDSRRGTTLLVMSTDAHAWPELYLAGFGWTVLDVAARRNLDPPQPPMDEELAELFGKLARQKGGEVAAATQPTPRPDGTWPALAFALAFVLVMSLLLLYAWKLWRRLAPALARRDGVSIATYRVALDILAELGHTRRYGESREQFARRVSVVAPAFVSLTELHVQDFLGGAQRTVEPSSCGRWLQRFKSEIGARVPRWRRWLGLLNPVSSFLTR